LEILKPAVTVFAPGFRISLRDVIVLAIGFALFLMLLKTCALISFVVAYTTGHFFLFCNVFRIALLGCTIFCGFPNWPITIAISLCVTVVVVVWEMKKPSYHGICWQQINPGLKNWWDANQAAQNLY
jgi:hypothetical protein